jgi:hypothetical protein
MRPQVQEAIKQFERDFAATIKIVGGTHEVYKRFDAEFQIDPSLNDSVDQYAVVLDATKNPTARGKLLREMVDEMYRKLCIIFLRLRDRGAFAFSAVEMTPELLEDARCMEEWAGLRQPLPKPVPPPTAEEILEETVILDYSGNKETGQKPLSSDAFRAKCRNSREYRATFERLAETNRLSAGPTTSHDINQVGH